MNKNPTVYLETTVPSYLVANTSRDVIVHAHQKITREWWDVRRKEFDIFVSDIVLLEAEHGDPDIVERRLRLMADLPVLAVDRDVVELAQLYAREIPLPARAHADAMHIALATVHGMDYLLTWNCRHIAHGTVIRRLASINGARGIATPTICTPEELLYED